MAPLRMFFPDLRRVALDPSGPVILDGEGWDIEVLWQFQETLLPQFENMLAILPDAFPMRVGTRDCPHWE